MRTFALFVLACIVGTAIATTGGSDEVLKCAEPKDSYITLRFLRHGLSCAQCCRDIAAKLRITNPKFLPCLQFLFDNKDPMLTDKGLQLLVNTAPKLQTCAPDQSWTVMSSPMTRTVETALALFPKFNVTVVPYMKECIAAPLLGRCTRPYSPDIAPEDQLCPNVDAQQRKLGPLKKNVIYDRETVKPGAMRTVDWAEAAHTTDPALFFKYLARYAKANNKRKFVVVTHNGVMIKLLMKFGVTPSLLQNAEMWEGKLTLSGDPVPKLKAVQVFKTPGTTASCSDMTTPQFNAATARCNVK